MLCPPSSENNNMMTIEGLTGLGPPAIGTTDTGSNTPPGVVPPLHAPVKITGFSV